MGFQSRFKKMAVGGFVEFAYSPKWLSQLDYYDRKPLIIFLGYDSSKNLIHGLNMHWLTVPQRKRVITLIKSAMNIVDHWDFGQPMRLDIYRLLKRRYPIATIAYRTYFPNRIRNVKYPAFQWEPDKVDSKIIHTDTAKIIGITPELLQKLARRAMLSRSKTRTKHAKARNKARKTTVKRSGKR